MGIQDVVVAEIEAFLKETGMAPTTFGVLCVNSKSFVSRVRKDPGIRGVTIDRVREFIANYYRQS